MHKQALGKILADPEVKIHDKTGKAEHKKDNM